MRTRTKLLMAALTAALVLSLGAGSAFALRSISISGETRLALNGVVTFTGGSIRVICNTTFNKTINPAISKTPGSQVGKVTSVVTEGCHSEGATFRTVIILGTANAELWKIIYNSFEGTLPTITGLNFTLEHTQVLLGLSIIGIAVSCLYEGNIGVHAAVSGGVIGRLKTTEERSETIEAGLHEGPGTCPSRGRFAAPAVTPLQTTSITLV